jgi:hypothetical protein
VGRPKELLGKEGESHSLGYVGRGEKEIMG